MSKSDTQIATLLSAGIVQAGDEWFIERKDGYRAVARVTLSGTLEMGGEQYTSPSTAAGAVLGTSTNGWKRWKFSDGGRTAYIDELRGRLSVGDSP